MLKVSRIVIDLVTAALRWRRLDFRSGQSIQAEIKEECLNRMIFVGQTSLRHAITQYLTHYHDERNHQGLENRLLKPCHTVGEPHAPVKRRERLGGMLSFYYREAA